MRARIKWLCLILAAISGAIALLSAFVFDNMELWAAAFLVFLPTAVLSVLFFLLIPLIRGIVAGVQQSDRERALRPPAPPSPPSPPAADSIPERPIRFLFHDSWIEFGAPKDQSLTFEVNGPNEEPIIRFFSDHRGNKRIIPALLAAAAGDPTGLEELYAAWLMDHELGKPEPRFSVRGEIVRYVDDLATRKQRPATADEDALLDALSDYEGDRGTGFLAGTALPADREMLLAHLCQIAYEQRQQGKRKEAEDLCFRYVSECPALLDARRAFIGAQRARTPFPGSALGAMRSYAESEDPDACPPLECLIRLRMEAGQHDQARALCDRALSFGLRSVQFKDWDAWKRGVERDRRKYGAPSLAQPLRGMTFVFTGTLETMIRKEAELRVEALGGYVSGVVNRDTRFLVCGKQSVSHKTTKLLAAEDENRKGASIRIIDEVEFLSLLQGDK